jgi:hypothetical protein
MCHLLQGLDEEYVETNAAVDEDLGESGACDYRVQDERALQEKRRLVMQKRSFLIINCD